MSRWLITTALLLIFNSGALAGEAASSDRERVLSVAREIDKFVDAGYAEHGVKPNPRIGDEQFARRVYLDVVGRIPTAGELTEFLAAKGADKRYDLIDRLFESEGRVSHAYNYWADLLRIKTRLIRQINGTPYTEWVKRAIRENMSYDQFVRELLSAEGRMTDNGAAGYYLRDSGMPLDNLANTVRIFLGTRIGCAQCHDHPFDKWTQYEYYELAAYTYGVKTRQRPLGAKQLRRAYRESELTKAERQVLQRLLQLQSITVSDTSKKLQLPDDYKYNDAKPGEVVEPHTIFGEPATPSPGQTPRQAFAAWVTSPENPRFAMVIANRLWKQAFGLGLVEPVDDFTDDTQPSNPALLAYLAAQVKAMNFDLQALGRAIYSTQAYHRQSTRTDVDPNQPYYFPGPVLRRMTAEQLWDSLLTLIVPDLDGRPGIPEMERGYALMELNISAMPADQIIAKAKEIAAQRGGGNPMMRKRFAMQLKQNQPGKYRGYPIDFVRASEGIAPAQPGSLIEQFGAADRELIDSATADPTVTQPLEMLNGEVTNRILESQSVVGRQVAAAKLPRAQVRLLFLSILGREPTADDMTLALAEVRAIGHQGLRNVAAALLNTREYMFVQ